MQYDCYAKTCLSQSFPHFSKFLYNEQAWHLTGHGRYESEPNSQYMGCFPGRDEARLSGRCLVIFLSQSRNAVHYAISQQPTRFSTAYTPLMHLQSDTWFCISYWSHRSWQGPGSYNLDLRKNTECVNLWCACSQTMLRISDRSAVEALTKAILYCIIMDTMRLKYIQTFTLTYYGLHDIMGLDVIFSAQGFKHRGVLPIT